LWGDNLSLDEVRFFFLFFPQGFFFRGEFRLPFSWSNRFFPFTCRACRQQTFFPQACSKWAPPFSFFGKKVFPCTRFFFPHYSPKFVQLSTSLPREILGCTGPSLAPPRAKPPLKGLLPAKGSGDCPPPPPPPLCFCVGSLFSPGGPPLLAQAFFLVGQTFPKWFTFPLFLEKRSSFPRRSSFFFLKKFSL